MEKIRKLLLLLLVLAYASQGLAVGVAPCPKMAAAGAMTGMSGMAEMSGMASMDHSGHHGATDSEAFVEPAADDCCDVGLCASSHCQSAPALPPAHPASSPPVIALYRGSAESAPPIHSRDSLYRPPISR